MNAFSETNQKQKWNYPSTKKVESSDTYFGITIKDNYQWLEDLKNDEVKEWFKSQSEYCDKILSIIPNREKLIQEMVDIDSIKKIKYSNIEERGGRYFFEKRLPGEEEKKLYFREEINGEDIFLFDPHNYREGKKFSTKGFRISKSGKKILINITEVGKETTFIKILDVDRKEFYEDELKLSSALDWIEDSDNIFLYSLSQGDDVHKMERMMDMKIMMHTIGEPETKDREILSRVHNPELKFTPEDVPYILYFNNCSYMFAGKGSVDNNQEIYFAPKSTLTGDKIEWKLFCKRDDEITTVIGYNDDVYMLTSKNASNFKILKTSLIDPDIAKAKLIFTGGDNKIESLNFTKDYLIITLKHNGLETYINKLKFNNEDKAEPVLLPLKGTIIVFPCSPYSNECVLFNSNWTMPYNLYSLNLENNYFEKGAFYIDSEYPGIENIVSEEIEVESHDGVFVPLSIFYDKTKFKKDGSNICSIEGYGAYGISISPIFNPLKIPLINRGVVYAFAHVRGGGEKGEDWHRAGMKSTKPNTWKDFIACAEYLINNGYTSSNKISASGTSAGGILLGRALTERPDLFKAAILKVSALNTLRSEFTPTGPVNIPEYGTVTVEDEFKGLLEMDPYEHLQEGENYPSTLITTGFNDPRVSSWIPAKFAAKMQNVNGSDNPVLLHVDYSTGHFGGESISDIFKNLADIYSFILWQCGDPDFQPDFGNNRQLSLTILQE